MLWVEYQKKYQLVMEDLKSARRSLSEKQFEKVCSTSRETLCALLGDIELVLEIDRMLRKEPEVALEVGEKFYELGYVPERAYDAVLYAGIHEKCPDANRVFIEPCVETFGHRKVMTDLLDAFQMGTNTEKAGVADALYWVEPGRTYIGKIIPENETEESKALNASLEDLIERKKTLFLSEFVKNEDVQVRRCLVPFLLSRTYSEDLKPLAEKACEIALCHPDKYIHERACYDLGLHETIPYRPDRT